MIDTIVIGAGPIGIYASFYLQQKGVKVLLVESTANVGGQLSNVYPEKAIYNIPGIKEIKAQGYINGLVEQMSDTVEVVTNAKVTDVKKEDNHFVVSTTNGTFSATSILLATGNGELKPRPLGIENEEMVSNIIYSITDMNMLKDQHVVIFGGGDSAIDWALNLEPIVKQVDVVHRRNEFRALDASVNQLRESSANIYTPHSIHEVEIVDTKIIKLGLINKDTQEVCYVSPDYIICNFGFVYEKNQISEWGVELDNNKVVVNRRHQTNIQGIFAIGDACIYENKNYNITTGLGEASVVANNIINYLDEMDGGAGGSTRTTKSY